ncbi:intracellular short-chain-length polyhydroxyalkanoate depolymerase [Bacillus massilinigeriensis]|uniref:intracellular short-chain-length polyhydroxyalkanoate depolymerase n=1 Tax=Bacillus massilionigeriensis TaxID=1805475 RepID=UPI000A695C26|nr:alpha/beta hydrolase [Bacillus massilionigeriensis]
MTISTLKYKSVVLPNGETIAFQEREGGEKKVLLVHGNMTSSKHWDLVLENMDAQYKLYAIDMRGFGKSSYRNEIRSIKDFSDDIKAFVDLIGLKGFSMIGWSTGGAVAMQFIAENPGYCEKLVLLASASTRGYPFYGSTEEGLPDIKRRLTTYEDIKNEPSKTIPIQHAYDTEDRKFLKDVWNALIYTKNQPNEELYEEYVDDMLTQKNLAEVYHALNTFNISNKHNGLNEGNGLVQNIKLPVLVLRGDRDFVVSDQMTKEIVEDLGEYARFVELEDCGHSPLIDDLQKLLNTITRFLG